MAITFSCDCGKQLRAREQFAGRRMKCPDCQKVLNIPRAEEPDMADLAVVDASQPEKPAAAEPDWLAAAVAEVADEPMESEAVPPVIAEPRPLPPTLDEIPDEMPLHEPEGALPVTTGFAPQEPPPLASPASRPRAKEPSWIDRSLDQRTTPWRAGDRERFHQGPEPRQRSFRWLKVAVILLLVGGIVYGGQVMPSIAERAAVWESRSDLDLVPPDAAAFLSVRLGDIWQGPSDKPLRSLLAPAFAKSIQDDLCINPDEIESATFVIIRLPETQGFPMMAMKAGPGGMKGGFGGKKGGFGGKKGGFSAPKPGAGKGGFGGNKAGGPPMKPAPGKPATGAKNAGNDFFDILRSEQHLLIVRTRGKIDAAIMHSLVNSKYMFHHKDRVIFMLRNSRLSGACLVLLNSKTALLGRKQDIERTLDDMDTPRNGPMQVALERAKEKQVVVALNSSRPMAKALPAPALAFYRRVVPGGAHGLLDAHAGILTLHDGDHGLAVDARLTFADKGAADKVAQAIPAAMTMELEAWARFVALAPPHFRPLLLQLSGAMTNMSVQQRESELEIATKHQKDVP